MNNKIIVVILVAIFAAITLQAQKIQNPIIQQQIQAELNKRGLKQAEVQTKLLSKGIDITKLGPEDYPKYEKQIQQAIAELEAEKKGNNTNNGSSVDDGKPAQVDTSSESPFDKPMEVKNNTNKKANKRVITDETAAEIAQAIKEGDNIDVVVAEKLDEVKPTTIFAPVYGMQIFRNKSIRVYRNTDDIKAADNYVLGVGDQLAISIWGVAEYEGVLTLNKEGYVQPDRMPRIYLKGVTYGKAKEILRAKFSQYYPFKPESFSVTVNYKRTITVNIYGEVFTPGGYSLPATNTAFNALVAAGGPSDIGSVRRIQLLREGAKPRTIDVYEFMNDPSIRDKFYLEDNDIIHVPIANRIITVQGAVRRPYKYELLPNENLMKLIDFAGGFADSAYYNIVQLKRYVDDKQVLIDINYLDLKNKKEDFVLLPGDIIMVNNIPKPFENYASIVGAVDFPKNYELTNGMKISDLLKKGVLMREARKDIAFLQRLNTDGTYSYSKITDLEKLIKNPSAIENIELQPKDKLIIYSQDKFSDKYNISVAGAVRSPQRYPYDVNQTIRIDDALVLAGGLKPEASDIGYVLRRKPDAPNTNQYIRVNLKAALSNKKSEENIVLQPSDSLLIISRKDFKDIFPVRIDGAVRNPGTYQYDSSLKLKDVITLTGGLLLQAATNRVEVSRIVIKNNEPTRVVVATLNVNDDIENQTGDYELQPFDQITVRTVPEFEFQKSINLQGEVKYPGAYTLINKNETLADVIERAGGLTSEAFKKGAQLYRTEDNVGYVVMDLNKALSDKNSHYNYLLKPNDLIVIPKKKDLVTLEGATRLREIDISDLGLNGQISTPFHRGKSAKFYINKYAGGFAENAKKADLVVIHPNGKITGTTNYGLFKVYPKPSKGSIVRVGYKPAESKKGQDGQEKKEPVNWEKLFANTIAQASGILTLILLVQQLSK